MLINHVLSSDQKSSIFDAIVGYFEEYAPPGARILVSTRPRSDADVHHYHRPHLEPRLSNRAITTVHHDLADPDSWLSFEKFLPRYSEAARVICLNQGQRERLLAAGVERTTVIPHGYCERVLRARTYDWSRAREPGRRIALGFLSKRYDRGVKGEAYLIDLAKRLHPSQFEFVLIGAGRYRTASDLAALGYEVIAFEHVPYRIFQDVYEHIDALLICSNFEGGPASVPEAIATATPILSTRVGMALDCVRDGVNGVLLSGDADLDAERLLPLADASGTMLDTLRRGALERVGSVPSWRDVVTRYFSIYHEVAQGVQR